MPEFVRPLPTRSPRARGRMALLLATVAATLLAAPAARAGTFPGDVAVGPLGTLKSLGDVDLAPDGSGALVYTVEENGADHVFVSRLWHGAWQGPERVDGALAGPSTQPVVSSADNGRISVAFVNGGNVYAATRPAHDRPWGALQTVWGNGGGSDPSVDLSVNRKGYLAFTAPGAGGHDVRLAYSRDAAPWTLIGAPIDANPDADAGSGTARPRVGAAADGIGVVAWGEAGHVWARRVQGTRPSVVVADASAGLTIEGLTPSALDLPVVGVQDDDSFTGIAFRALFSVDGTTRSRVVYRRLRGSRFENGGPVDATPFSSGQGSVDPGISNGGVGQGIVLGASDVTHLSYAMLMRADLTPGPIVQVDSVAQSTAPTYAVPATATPLKMIVAWQLTTADGATDVRGRFYDGRDFQPEQVLSRPELGPTNANLGLAASGDDQGDLVVAYVQQVPGQGPAISVATVDQPPGRFSPLPSRVSFERTDRPVLRWTRPRESWGLGFKVAVDGVEVGATGSTALRLPAPIGQGQHSWQVTATDVRGQQFAARARTVRVDTVAPTARVRITGARRVGIPLRLTVQSADAPPPPAPGAQPIRTSGVATVLLDWGDGTRTSIKRGSQHVFTRAGRYAVRVVVTDKAGNRTTVRQPLKVITPPRPRRHARHRRGQGGGRAAARA